MMVKSLWKWALASGVLLVMVGCAASRPPTVFVDPSYNHNNDVLAQQAIRDPEALLATAPVD